MTNIIKFPRHKDGKQQQDQPVRNTAGHGSNRTLRHIVHGVIGAVYIVLISLWTPVRFLLIANVVLQFFRMFFKWDQGPFSAACPFVLSFLVLAVLTYLMASWKPKTP